MADYIKREVATTYAPLPKELREYQTYNLDDAFEYGYDFAIQQIDAVPAADVVEVRYGKWEEVRWTTEDDWGCINHRSIVCTACDTAIYQGEPTPYCPYCGAKMSNEALNEEIY